MSGKIEMERREEREIQTRESGKESISDLWQSKSVGVSPALLWEPALPEH